MTVTEISQDYKGLQVCFREGTTALSIDNLKYDYSGNRLTKVTENRLVTAMVILILLPIIQSLTMIMAT